MESLRFLMRQGFGFYEVFPSIWSVYGYDGGDTYQYDPRGRGTTLPEDHPGVRLLFQGNVTDLLSWLEETLGAQGNDRQALERDFLGDCKCFSPQRDQRPCPHGGVCEPIQAGLVCGFWTNCRKHLGRGFCRECGLESFR